MNRKDALKRARHLIGDISRRSATEFVWYVPYSFTRAAANDSRSGAALMECRDCDLKNARGRRQEQIAEMALIIMGHVSNDPDAGERIYYAAHRLTRYTGGHPSAEQLLGEALRSRT